MMYKGLERPVVIIADVKAKAERCNFRMNIAFDRAVRRAEGLYPGGSWRRI
jgi:hypothetical protein